MSDEEIHVLIANVVVRTWTWVIFTQLNPNHQTLEPGPNPSHCVLWIFWPNPTNDRSYATVMPPCQSDNDMRFRKLYYITNALIIFCCVKVKVKGKVFPCSLPSVGPRADPGVQAVSPQVTWSESRHRHGSRLLLLSARTAVTSVAFTRWRYL